MQKRNYRDEKKASIIAAAITFGAALIILVLLFVLTVGDDRRMLAETSMPEMQDDEEIFLDPELMMVDHIGEEESDLDVEQTAQQPPGQPDPAPEEQPVRVVRNEEQPKEEVVSSKPKLVSSDKPNEVKTSSPKLSLEEEKRIASMGGKFKTENNGGNTPSESTGSSINPTGQLSGAGSQGRKMESCPRQSVKASQKVVVTVDVKVNAQGLVTSATARGGNEEQRKQCEQMARGSRWTPKAGEGEVPGKITFTIIPR